MRDVAIIGAGELGGLAAHVLARRDLSLHISLIEDAGRIAEGKALDITQAAAIEGFATQVSGSRDMSRAAGAALVVLADRLNGGEWQGEEGLALLSRLNQLAPRSIVVCAGASQQTLVERGVRELAMPRTRLFGSAPEALAAAARAMVALEANGSARDVALSVLGMPPQQIVIPWEDSTFGGFGLTRVLDEVARRRIAARIHALWPPGPYALACAASLAVEAICGRSRRIVSCFLSPDVGAGARSRTAALPVRLDASGIAAVVLPALSAHDRVALDNAILL